MDDQQRPMLQALTTVSYTDAGSSIDTDTDTNTNTDSETSALYARSVQATGSAQGYGEDIRQRLLQEGAGRNAALILGHMADAGYSMGAWAARYMLTKVCGRPKNTVIAKSHDLAIFVTSFVQSHHADADASVGKGSGAAASSVGDIRRWSEADTRYFLSEQVRLGKSPATINRMLYTIQHFAGFVRDQPGSVFSRYGFPIGAGEAMHVDEPPCKKLSQIQVRALFAAARAAVQRADGKVSLGRARPRRDLAVLAVFCYTGLRVSEVVSLTREQYESDALNNVQRKGGRRTRKTVLHPECVRLLDDYLKHERDLDVRQDATDGGAMVTNGTATATPATAARRPLFLTAREGGIMHRKRVASMLARLAKAAAPFADAPFHVHPHALRHTFGATYREASGSDTETAAALGHAGLQYVGRYVRKTDEERAELINRAFGALHEATRDRPGASSL